GTAPDRDTWRQPPSLGARSPPFARPSGGQDSCGRRTDVAGIIGSAENQGERQAISDFASGSKTRPRRRPDRAFGTSEATAFARRGGVEQGQYDGSGRFVQRSGRG